MDVRITVETTVDNVEKRTHQLDGISRPYRVTCQEGFGLRLEDGKTVVEQVQRANLCDQVEEIIRESRARRLRCFCDARSAAMPGGPISPLAYFFPDRATSELQRLHAELGSRHSFGETARLMKSFPPATRPITPRSVTGWEE
jgi:hypothetical protein